MAHGCARSPAKLAQNHAKSGVDARERHQTLTVRRVVDSYDTFASDLWPFHTGPGQEKFHKRRILKNVLLGRTGFVGSPGNFRVLGEIVRARALARRDAQLLYKSGRQK